MDIKRSLIVTVILLLAGVSVSIGLYKKVQTPVSHGTVNHVSEKEDNSLPMVVDTDDEKIDNESVANVYPGSVSVSSNNITDDSSNVIDSYKVEKKEEIEKKEETGKTGETVDSEIVQSKEDINNSEEIAGSEDSDVKEEISEPEENAGSEDIKEKEETNNKDGEQSAAEPFETPRIPVGK